ncbi:Serine/threonine kinase [Blastocladiella emersonii ATCC 22665]|nr:Serine/threonine kinase [Blastocladiella emersonii ATCC 22665]
MDPSNAARIAEIHRKLAVEEAMRSGAEAMRAKLTDRNALAQCEATLDESAKRIAFLQAQLDRLHLSGSASSSTQSLGALGALPGGAMPSDQQHQHLDAPPGAHAASNLSTSSSMRDFPATMSAPTLVCGPDDHPHLSSQASGTATPPHSPSAIPVAVAVPVHGSSESLNAAGSGSGGGGSSHHAGPLAGSGARSIHPTTFAAASAAAAAGGSSASTTSTSGSSGGLFSYFKKSMRSKSASSIHGLADPRGPLAQQLPGTLGELLLSGPPPVSSLPPNDDPAASNLDLSRAGVALSTAQISNKMRDLTYKLEVAAKGGHTGSMPAAGNSASASSVRSWAAAFGGGGGTQTAGAAAAAADGHAAAATAAASAAPTDPASIDPAVHIDALKRALNKYSGLYVPDPSATLSAVAGGTGTEPTSPTGDLPPPPPGLPGFAPATPLGTLTGPPPMVSTIPRRAQPKHAGELAIHLVAARVPPSVKNALSRSRADHYMAVVQVDGVVKGRSRAFKAPKDKSGSATEIPFNEVFTVALADKAAEVEVVLVEADKHGVAKMVDGMLWFRLADVVAAIEANGGTGATESGEVSGWFDLDPVGAVLVRAQFTTAARPRKPSRLGRQGAVRKKKVEATRNGHRFVLAQYANIVKCALCSEFIGVSSCYACEACAFSCHKKCAPRVLTRCFAANPAGATPGEEDEDEEPLPHNIPHRFTAHTNLKANWCCHCGHLVPLGRGNVKCGECDLVAHKGCSMLVPNFCGLSMKRANKMIHEIKLAKDMRAANAIRIAQRAQQMQEHQAAVVSAAGAAGVGVPEHVAAAATADTAAGDEPPAAPDGLLPPPPTMIPVAVPSVGKAQVDVDGAAAIKPAPVGVVVDRQVPVVVERQDLAPPPGAIGKGVSLDDFVFLAVLGKGNFGKVMLAEEKHSRKLYAIKVLKKDFVIENDEVESTRSEKRIFQAANASRHPFLINLYATLQTKTRLYFVMEYVSGGDLMLHIQREQFSERRAKFYACEVLLALEFFHKHQIVYRDLKLDNIMLSLDGHIKLADYGLCKENMAYGATTNTFCGTPEFMAPEILFEQNYGRAVDWWAFGVLVYEMICGQSPFRGDDEEEIFEAILHDEVLYPITMSRDAVALCQGLLTKDPRRRLGAGPADADEIKRHPFFRGVDWDALLAKRIAPPFVPRITGAKDVSNFDEEFTREPPVLTPIHTVLDDAEQLEFAGFSYVADWVNEVR